MRYECDAKGTALNFEVVSDTIGCVREGKQIPKGWKKRIEEDYAERGEH